MPDKKKILIIDDESSLCLFMKLNLQRTGGFEVFTASSGKEGIEAARDKKPDIILLDVVMPAISGPEVAKSLQADPATKDIPIVFLTGVIDHKEMGMGDLPDVDRYEFVTKPIQTEELITVINRLLP